MGLERPSENNFFPKFRNDLSHLESQNKSPSSKVNNTNFVRDLICSLDTFIIFNHVERSNR